MSNNSTDTERDTGTPVADTIFENGALFLGDAPAAECTGEPVSGRAVVVINGKIHAVVAQADAEKFVGPHTRRVDLEGALLVPGFQDAHLHPISGGVELLQCNLSGAHNAAEAVQMITEYARTHPDEPWILGGGWSMDHFPGGSPTKDLIDAVVPDRPVLLSSADHHSSWANSAAIALAGIDVQTPEPVDGRVERDAQGAPAGTFHEGAEKLFDGVCPANSAQLQYDGLLKTQEEMFKLGVTGWQDALIGGILNTESTLDVYLRALAEGTLRAYVRGCQWWWREKGEEQFEDLRARREQVRQLGSPRFELEAVKIMVDGVAENFTAAMNTPYRDAHGCTTENRGLSFVDPQKLRSYVSALDAEGFQVHFHALGDRAVAEALAALEQARADNGVPSEGQERRHHLAHLQVVDKSDVPRFAELDATANMQALWATHESQLDELTLPFLEPEAESRHYPFGELARAGVRLAAGSDWPVSSANPIEAIHIAVNRVYPGGTQEPLAGEEQKLSLAQALAAYTSGSAYVNHNDNHLGYLKPGYTANLAVISPNPFEVAEPDIHASTVQSTWVEGKEVYRAQRS